jgi:hypothetical protein
MDDAEDGRVRRNPERQGENGGRGKSRASPQRPYRVAQIAPQDLDRGERLKRSTIFLQQGGVAELPCAASAASSLDIPCATNLSASSRTCSWISSSKPSSRCCLLRNPRSFAANARSPTDRRACMAILQLPAAAAANHAGYALPLLRTAAIRAMTSITSATTETHPA